MKTIGIFLGKPNPAEYLLDTPYYYQGYVELSAAITEAGGKMVLLGDQESYQSGGTFNRHWLISPENISEHGSITVDTVYDKSFFVSDGQVAVFNHPEINSFCIDKWKTYQQFSEYCPLTLLIHNQNELETNLSKIHTELVVAKPVDGGEGKNVFIVRKNEILHQQLSFPILLQEFLDSSQGIPGIMQGIHDLRIATLNGEIAYSFFRTPPKGKLIANVAQGGAFEVIDNDQIPQEAVALIKKIDQFFEKFPSRYYGVDVAFTPQGLKIIELNSRLGLSLHSDGDVFRETNEKLAKVLVEYSL